MNKTLILASIVLISLTTCKSTKKIFRSELKKTEEIYQELSEKAIPYDWFGAKARIKVKTEELNQSATLYLRVRHDSLIWGSVNFMLGFEVLRFYIDENQVTIIDKIRKQYIQEPLTYIEEQYSLPAVDLRMIENLITGYPVFNLKENFEVKSFEKELIVSRKDQDMDETVFIDLNHPRISQYLLERLQMRQKVEVKYREDITDGAYTIPRIVDIKIYLPDENSFTLTFTNIRFNKPYELNTGIPAGYEKIE